MRRPPSNPATLFAAFTILLIGGAASGAAPIQVGDQVPNFTLTSIDGDDYTLSESVADGPVVVVLYRGVW